MPNQVLLQEAIHKSVCSTGNSQSDEPLQPACHPGHHSDGVLQLYPLYQLQQFAKLPRSAKGRVLRHTEHNHLAISFKMLLSSIVQPPRHLEKVYLSSQDFGDFLTRLLLTNFKAMSITSTENISFSDKASMLNSLQGDSNRSLSMLSGGDRLGYRSMMLSAMKQQDVN